MRYLVVSASADHYSCLNALNCTGKNMSKSLVHGLGEADANNYLCSKDLRPGKNYTFPFFHIIKNQLNKNSVKQELGAPPLGGPAGLCLPCISYCHCWWCSS